MCRGDCWQSGSGVASATHSSSSAVAEWVAAHVGALSAGTAGQMVAVAPAATAAAAVDGQLTVAEAAGTAVLTAVAVEAVDVKP